MVDDTWLDSVLSTRKVIPVTTWPKNKGVTSLEKRPRIPIMAVDTCRRRRWRPLLMRSDTNALLVCLLSALCFFARVADCHVALTYPPARKYDLDFLDNVRTKGPCGMPKGDIRTSLISGAPFNITWHLAYPHQGGFRLELLDHLERSILDLTPKTETSDFVTGDATAQQFELKFPHTFECKDCTIRLIRQANEWSKKYLFWSCADVDIYKRGSKKVDCNGHGNYLGGRCICERLYFGDRCQFADECTGDNDCGRQGVCVDVKATSYPKKQCYCRPGYFGEKCNKKSDIKTLNSINFGAYSRKDLSDKLTMYWRILRASNELEVVLQANATSYVALGWKPQGLTTKCRLFPHITDAKPAGKAIEAGQAEPEPEPEAEPAAGATTPAGPKEKAPVPATGRGRPRYRFIDSAPGDAPAAAEPEPAAEKKEDKTTEAEPEPEVAAEAEPEAAAAEKKKEKTREAEPEPEPETAAEPEPAAEAEPKPTTTEKSVEEPKPKEAADSEPEPEPSTTEEPPNTTTKKKPATRTKSPAATTEAPVAEPEPTSEPEPEPESEPEPSTTSKSIKPKAKETATAAPEPEPAATEAETAEGSTTTEPETTTEFDAETTTAAQRRKRQAPKLELEGWRPISSVNQNPIDRRRQPVEELDYVDRADTGPVEFADQDPHAGSHDHHGASSAHDHHDHDHGAHSDHDHAQHQGDAQAEPEPEGASAEPEAAPEPEAAAEPTSPPATATKPVSTENSYAPKGDKKLHAMDCSDIVIGSARGAAHRLDDYYTRDRSTPRVDSFWGFESDLTAAFGFEENGVTTIAFRRKLEANEPTDHSIVDAPMTVIWARGQEPGQYVHSPHSGLEKGAASDPDFYRPDEIKYHGQKDQRGVLSMNFFEEDVEKKSAAASDSEFCGGEFRYPRTCSDSDCEYTAKWEYDEGSDNVKFTVTSRHTKNRWTGIGFSKDTRMGQSDAILGWIDRSGRSFIADWWIKGYQAPELDSNQDISETSVSQEDGVITLQFTRPRVLKDEQDHSLDECIHFLYPIKGGDVKAVSKKMGKHDARPEVSAEKICIRSCSAAGAAGVDDSDNSVDGVKGPAVTTARTTTTTTQKPQLFMDVELKVLDVGDNFVVPRKNSPEYRELSERVKRDISTALTSVPGFEDLSVTDFESTKENELIAKLLVTLDHEAVSKEYKGRKQGGESEKAKEMVSKALEDRITTGQIGELRVDPQYLIVGEPVVQKEAQATTFWAGLSDSQLKLYIVIAAIGFLVLVAVMQASCTIHRLRKRSSGSKSHKEGLITNSAWKDYSAATGSTNYAYEPFDPTAAGADERAGKRGVNGTSSRPRGGPPGSGAHQLRNGAGAAGYSAAPYGDSRSLQRAPKNGGPVVAGPKGSDRYTNSLPRPSYGAPNQHPGGYHTQDRSLRNSYAGPSSSSSQAPDFYFMPSQRKYSGEIVRVYVDYNQHHK